MSSLTYTALQLAQLPSTELRQIIQEQGWTPQLPNASADQLALYILDLQAGKGRVRAEAFGAGMVTTPVNEAVAQLQEFYLQKQSISNQLFTLSDPALFAVVDTMGWDLKLSPPYVQVDGRQLKDKMDLVWYLVGIVSE